MNKNKLTLKTIGAAVMILATGTAAVAHAQAVWKADLKVKIAAVKGDQIITYTITVENIGDDAARDNVISHTPSYVNSLNKVSIASVNAKAATCSSGFQGNGASIKCTLPVLAHGASETITVVVNNPGNHARTGTAQAMGITPDPKPSNNFDSVKVP